MIAEGISKTLILNNVEVKGNLILREDIDTAGIISYNDKYLLDNSEETINTYQNDEYGIKFTIPNQMTVLEIENKGKQEYNKNDIITISIKKNNDYLLKSVGTLASDEMQYVNNRYSLTENGKTNDFEYALYGYQANEKNNYFLVIKRDDVLYTIVLNNITYENVCDTIIGTMELFDGEKIDGRKDVIYKNKDLKLKFVYKDGYVSVDDSYNTGIISSGDKPFKLFIQVNRITDIEEYSFEDIIYYLKMLAKDDGVILNTVELNVCGRNAVKFEIQSDNKLNYSLYFVDGKSLYKFIFVSEKEIMQEVGNALFESIINSIEL